MKTDPQDSARLDWLETHTLADIANGRASNRFETPAQPTDGYEKPAVREAIDLAMREGAKPKPKAQRYTGKLRNGREGCEHELDPHCWSGVRCLHCPGWFCY